MDEEVYPDLHNFSKSRGIAPEKLIKAFEIERAFHSKILEETSFENRQKLYKDVYRTVHSIYGKTSNNILEGKNPKDSVVRLFKSELEGKSILDIGCGEGYFLASVAKQIAFEQLVGLDVSIPSLSKKHPDIRFICGDIIDFDLDQQFDVIFCDQVLEHIAPVDIDLFLKSVKRALGKNGVFVVILPNRHFGPCDVTRIIDFSYTGKTKAQGTHLNESTYTELIPILERHGFGNFKAPLSLPKLKHMFPDFRISPSFFVFIEKNRFLMRALHSVKRSGQCVARFPVALISSVL